jgi:hypothetical protein
MDALQLSHWREPRPNIDPERISNRLYAEFAAKFRPLIEAARSACVAFLGGPGQEFSR